MTSISVVVFDLDDTLYPEREYAVSGFTAASEMLKKTHGVDDFLPALLEAFEIEGPAGRTFQRALEVVGMPVLDATVKLLVAAYHDQPSGLNITPYPEVNDVLKTLSQKYDMGLISDGRPEIQSRKLEALGLTSYFDSLIFTTGLGPGAHKPAPVAFNLTMSRFNVGGGQCIYVGNDPSKDFIAPAQLGWQSVQVMRPNALYSSYAPDSVAKADSQIDDLTELIPILESRVDKGRPS